MTGASRRAKRSRRRCRWAIPSALAAWISPEGAAASPRFQSSPPATPDRTAASVPPPSRPEASPPAPLSLDAWRVPLIEPLVSDRPDFTESTEPVPRGHFQLESGYTFTYDREQRQRRREHVAPELLLRAGLFDRFELRLGWPGYSWTRELFQTESSAGRPVSREEASQGASDPSVGFKFKFCEQENLRPHLAVIAEMSAPSGSRGVSAGDVEPTAKLLWSYDWSESLALSGNANLSLPREAGDRFVQVGHSVSLSVSWSDTVGTYIEYFGFYPNARDSDCAHTLNGGITYLVTDNLQLDWRAGFGLNEEADDFFTGIGFVWRW